MDNALCFISQEQHLMQRVQPEQAPPFSQALDMYIHSQSERLRTALQEQRNRQVSALIKKHESRVQILITQKEMEIEEASRRSAELRDFLRRMESESLSWQRAARESESLAASLTGAIQRLRESAAGDAESCCGEEEAGIRDARLVCKRCGHRESRVIVLPCRHLCSCRECDALLDSCPVCRTVKKASIEAFI